MKLGDFAKWKPPAGMARVRTKDFSCYRNDPIGFFREILNYDPTAPQRRIVSHLLRHRETNVQAAHAVGKTSLSACIALFWIFVRNGLVITTAPTHRQVEKLLWGEVRQLYQPRRDILGGTMPDVAPELKLTATAMGYGFTARHNNSNAFQGVHSRHGLLVIEDEACGISQEIDDGATSCVAGSADKILRVGNPIVSGTPFHDNCKRSSLIIPVWEHPNLAGYYDPHGSTYRLKPEYRDPATWPDASAYPVPGAVSIDWVENTRQRKGESSPYWASRVEGRFPDSNAAALIPAAWFDMAVDRFDEAATPATKMRWGVDVGDRSDAHAIAAFAGNELVYLEEMEVVGDGTDIDRLIRHLKDLVGKGDPIAIDATGVGAGVVSAMRSAHYDVRDVFFGQRAENSSAYQNWVAEAGWKLREAMQPPSGLIVISPECDHLERLATEFDRTYYVERSNSKTGLEPKDDTKKRLGRSPNLRDAVLLAYDAPQPRGVIIGTLGDTGW